jgi:hypothetical protein
MRGVLFRSRWSILVLAVVAAALCAHVAWAAPPGSVHVYGGGSSQWGTGPQAGTQSFSLNVFTTSTGELGGHMSWHGMSPAAYPFRLDFSGHPSCLAVSPDGQLAAVAVVRYIRSEQSYVGPIEIIQAGSPELATSELLEAADLPSAESVCAEIVDFEDFPPLPALNGQVTIVG